MYIMAMYITTIIEALNKQRITDQAAVEMTWKMKNDIEQRRKMKNERGGKRKRWQEKEVCEMTTPKGKALKAPVQPTDDPSHLFEKVAEDTVGPPSIISN